MANMTSIITRHLSDHHAVQGEAEYVERHAPVTASPDWQPIETAPHDTELLLGWHDTFGSGQWRCIVDLAHSTRGGWWHGSATHWMPLPAAPEAEGGSDER